MPSPTALPEGLSMQLDTRVAERPQPSGPEDGFPATAPERGLLIDYRVRNTGAQAVLLNDRIPALPDSASGATARVDVLKAFVLRGPHDAVTIAKRTFRQRPAPAGPDFTVRFQASVLRPGNTVSGRAFVPFPLAASLPGFAADEGLGEGLPSEPTRWSFCLGVTPTVYQPEVLPGGEHALIGNNILGGPRAQRMLCSKTMPLPGGWNGR